jgi:hypothetical protein
MARLEASTEGTSSRATSSFIIKLHHQVPAGSIPVVSMAGVAELEVNTGNSVRVHPL